MEGKTGDRVQGLKGFLKSRGEEGGEGVRQGGRERDVTSEMVLITLQAEI